MLEVVSITGVVFVIIAVGYASVRLSLFAEKDMHVLGRFVINFALPALIFRAVAGRDFGQIFDAGILGAYFAGSVGMFAAGYAWSRRAARLSPAASTFQGMGMSCTNSGYFGYPIVLMAIPSIATTALALCMIVENLVMIPLVLVMAERASGGSAGGRALGLQIAGRLARNPIVIALVAGMAVSLLGLEVPRLLAEPINLLASASVAVSLIVIGGTLGGLSLRAVDTRLIPVVVGKLVLHPLVVWLGLLAAAGIGFAASDPRVAQAVVLMSAMSTMGIYPILAQRYGQQSTAALALLVMTGLAFFTISGAMWLLGVVPAG